MLLRFRDCFLLRKFDFKFSNFWISNREFHAAEYPFFLLRVLAPWVRGIPAEPGRADGDEMKPRAERSSSVSLMICWR